MQQQQASTCLSSSNLQFPFFRQPKRLQETIVIESQSDSLDLTPKIVPFTSSAEQLQKGMEIQKDKQENTRNGFQNMQVEDGPKSTDFCQFQFNSMLTSNCLLNRSSLSQLCENQISTQSSFLNQSSPAPFKNMRATQPSKTTIKSLIKKMKEKNLFSQQVKDKVTDFKQKLRRKDVTSSIEKELWLPPKKYPKKKSEASQNKEQSQNQLPFFSKKITRAHYKQFKPLLDDSFKDADLEEELQRYQNGNYRYKNPFLSQMILHLGKKISSFSPRQTRAAVPQVPSMPFSSNQHVMMVNVLSRQLGKRRVVFIE